MPHLVKTGVAAICLLAAGCSNPGSINIRETWGRSIGNFGLQAVYPMREDFFVGDILLMGPDCEDGNIPSRPDAVLIGSLGVDDLKHRFGDYYGRRAVFPIGPAADPGAAKTQQAGRQPTAADIFPPEGAARQFDRLRMAAFPAFSVGTFAKGDLGLTSASAGLGRFLGLSGRSASHVSVSLAQVEEVQLPAPQMLDAIYGFLASEAAETVLDPENMGEIAEHLRLRTESDGARCVGAPSLVFVNRVFYARSIDFDFGSEAALSAVIGAAIERASAIEQRPSFTNAPAGAAPAPAPAPTAADPSAERTADVLGAALRTLAGAQAPGVGASFAVGQYGGLVLRQSFERPLAFGVGLTYAYDLADMLEWVLTQKLEREKQSGLIRAGTQSARLFLIQDEPEPESASETEAELKRYEAVIDELRRLDPKKPPKRPLQEGPEAEITRPAPVLLEPSAEAMTVQ
jgi:hypothetical protein